MNPDPRLCAILSEADGKVLCDVGTDHGYIAVGALLKGKAERVVAADVSEKCLAKCVALAREKGVESRLKAFVSDGFSEIDDDIDVAVIAGLGGYETIKILKNAEILGRVPEKLVLCPHQNAKELRAYLKNYCIEKDYVVKSGTKFYPVIVALKGGDGYRDEELEFGKNMPPTHDFDEMISTRKRVLEERFSGREMPDAVRREYEEILRLC